MGSCIFRSGVMRKIRTNDEEVVLGRFCALRTGHQGRMYRKSR